MEYELNRTYGVDDLSELEGTTLYTIKRGEDARDGNDYITFLSSNGFEYTMMHIQDCCEHVTIEDIEGDLDDMINSPLTMAEESCNSKTEEEHGDSETWTFYRFATIKGYVTIRWYGSSNGYYSESVDVSKRLSPRGIRMFKLNHILDE